MRASVSACPVAVVGIMAYTYPRSIRARAPSRPICRGGPSPARCDGLINFEHGSVGFPCFIWIIYMDAIQLCPANARCYGSVSVVCIVVYPLPTNN